MAETVASYQVPEHHVKMYTANVQALMVKMPMGLDQFVTQGSYVGEKAQVVNFIGPIEFTERDTPYSDTQVSEVEHTQRWVLGTEYDCAVFIDRLDTLKMIYDPTNPYVARMHEAWGRKKDEIVMNTFFGSSKTGKDGATDTAFKAANIVAHGSAGLTVAKLRSARKLVKKRHVDLRIHRPTMAVTADEVDDLIGETQVGSSDYNAVKPLVDGEVSRFMGIDFVPYEDTGDNADGKSIPQSSGGLGTIRDHPLWVRDGMHYGAWAGLTITVSNRPDKNNIKQVHATFTGGATRLEENQVFKVQTTRA